MSENRETLNQEFVPVAEDQRAKPVPLRFEDPILARPQLVNSFSEHRQYPRIHWKIHASEAITVTGANQSAKLLGIRVSIRNFRVSNSISLRYRYLSAMRVAFV
jgi:hypothetical protein